MAGRKRIDLEMDGTKGNRQRIWEAIRANADGFTGYQIARKSNTHDDVVRSYLQSLIKAGFVETDGAKIFEEQTLHLVKDVGMEAPAVTRSGKPSTAGRGTEAMWRAIRILRELDADALVEQASAAVPVTKWTAKSYLKWLTEAGYLVVVSGGKGPTPARYRLAPGKDTGPQPPMIQRIGQVFDPNLGAVVYSRKITQEDAA